MGESLGVDGGAKLDSSNGRLYENGYGKLEGSPLGEELGAGGGA